ncbi:hypothetical protein BD770DRAFT_469629 [Pilaira anomala]|nr:hypothetical protein BD770DRAFT_469629 [Pilaira anomala]
MSDTSIQQRFKNFFSSRKKDSMVIRRHSSYIQSIQKPIEESTKQECPILPPPSISHQQDLHVPYTSSLSPPPRKIVKKNHIITSSSSLDPPITKPCLSRSNSLGQQ